MSDKYPTLDALVALGFEHREPKFGMKTVGYQFHYLDLKASASISMYFRLDVLLNGVLIPRGMCRPVWEASVHSSWEIFANALSTRNSPNVLAVV